MLRTRFEDRMSCGEIAKKPGLPINTFENNFAGSSGVEAAKTLYVVKRREPKINDKKMEKRIKQLEMEV